MDAGCYAIHLLRVLAAQEPTVTRAQARLIALRVDHWMQAEVAFAGGLTGRLTCSLLARPLLRIGARVQGERGEMRVVNVVQLQRFHRLSVQTAQGRRTLQLARVPTYVYQLRAFVVVVHTRPAHSPERGDQQRRCINNVGAILPGLLTPAMTLALLWAHERGGHNAPRQ